MSKNIGTLKTRSEVNQVIIIKSNNNQSNNNESGIIRYNGYGFLLVFYSNLEFLTSKMP